MKKLVRASHSVSGPEMKQRLAETLEILLSSKSQFEEIAFSEDFKSRLRASPLVQTKTKRKSA